MKKLISILGVFGFIYIGCYTDWIEEIFNTGGVARSGGLVEYILLGIIASILILKK